MRSSLIGPYGGTCRVGDGGGRRLGMESKEQRERGERQKDTLKSNNSFMRMIVTFKSDVFT